MFLIDLLQYFVNQLLIRFFVADNKNVKGDQSQSQDQSSPWMQPYPNEPYPYPQYQPPPQPCPSQKPPSNSQQQPQPQQPPCPSQQQQQQPQYPPPQYPPQQYPDYPQSQYPVNPPLQEQIPTNDAYCCGCSWLKYCNCCGENCGWYLKCCQNCGCANCCNCDCLSACISNTVNCILQTASCGGCDCNCGGSFRDSDNHQRSDNNPLTLRGCDGCSGCDCCMTRRAIDTIEVTANSTNEPNFSFEPMSSGSGGSSDCCCCDCSSLCSRLYSTVISAVISSPLGFMSFMRESAELLRRMSSINYIYSRRYVTSGDLKRHGGKVAVITYGNSGVGAQMAKILLKLGFRVIVGWKENVSGESAVKPTESKQLKVLKLDSSSLESVREFAKEVSKSEDKIDLLINSAGSFEVQNIITKDGIEKTFAENYLGQFLLTNLLINKLKKAENGRIVNVSSIAHYLGYMDYNTVTNKDPSYSALRAYAQSKLATVLFTRELSKRIIDTNMSAYVVSPEIIEKRMPLQNRAVESLLAKITDPMNGIQTLLYVSLDEELKNESGFYYNNLKKVYPLMINASDDKESVNLWKRSEKLVKLEDEYKLNRGAKTSQTAQEVTTEATNITNVKAAEVTPDVTQQEEVNASGEEDKGTDIEKSMSDQIKLEESQD